MNQIQHITSADAKVLITESEVILADIRDKESYLLGHIEGAIHVTNDNLTDFIRDNDLDQPLIVYCFHGLSSQPAAQFLLEQGFEDVYSLIGGYEAWRAQGDSCT